MRVLVHHSAGLCDQQCEREKHAEPRGLAAAGQELGLCHTCKYSVGRELSRPGGFSCHESAGLPLALGSRRPSGCRHGLLSEIETIAHTV